MDRTRTLAMDAQRFDPSRKAGSRVPHLSPPLSSHPPRHLPTRTKTDMGQFLRRLSHPLPSNGVGGIWSDHELVLVPLDVAAHRTSLHSVLARSFASTASSTSTSTSTSASSSHSTSTYFSTAAPEGALETAPSDAPSTGSRQVETYDREDLIITRTIIRPTPARGGMLFSRPSSPALSRPASPLSRPTTPAFQALNCFRPQFEPGPERETGQPVLQVIVTQTREQYEQDLAFKEVVQEVYPEASRRRRTVQNH